MLEICNFTQNEINEDFFKKVLKNILKTADIKRAGLNLKQDEIEISLAIVGDGRMRKLNKFYRGKNKTTDVLSFGDKSVLPYLKGKFVEPLDGVKRLGEVVICYPRAKKQAKRFGHSLEKELTKLFIHGMLHLLGYEHEKSGKEAEEMEKLENKLLKINICA